MQVQKVPFGVDPKTVVCTFYKQGNCEKGKKCKFSHDLSVERKGEKKNLYQDTREGEDEAKKKDDMAEWDEGESRNIYGLSKTCPQHFLLILILRLEKLRQVVMSKHGNPKTTTDKVCKYFISAVEEGKYGWFWTCPNGGDKCMYKHSLPPGFVLKTKEQRAAEKALMDKSPLKTLTLEDFLESERHKLTGTLTPVTPESFAKWKKERLDKKAAEDEARQAKEATGRAMFEKGGWEDSEEEDESEEEGDAEGEADEWDMESMRRETERIREENEKKRLEDVGGQAATETDGADDQEEEGDEAVGVKEGDPNGVNGHADDT